MAGIDPASTADAISTNAAIAKISPFQEPLRGQDILRIKPGCSCPKIVKGDDQALAKEMHTCA